MKIYLAGPYASRFDLRKQAKILEDLGHEITSSWIYESDKNDALSHRINQGTYNELDVIELRRIADYDMSDLYKADCVIMQSVEKPSRGGRHFEMGYALCLHHYFKPVKLIIIGKHPETVFYFLPVFEFYETWDDLFGELKDASSN